MYQYKMFYLYNFDTTDFSPLFNNFIFLLQDVTYFYETWEFFKMILRLPGNPNIENKVYFQMCDWFPCVILFRLSSNILHFM